MIETSIPSQSPSNDSKMSSQVKKNIGIPLVGDFCLISLHFILIALKQYEPLYGQNSETGILPHMITLERTRVGLSKIDHGQIVADLESLLKSSLKTQLKLYSEILHSLCISRKNYILKAKNAFLCKIVYKIATIGLVRWV